VNELATKGHKNCSLFHYDKLTVTERSIACMFKAPALPLCFSSVQSPDLDVPLL